jgi:hypothetical protein
MKRKLPTVMEILNEDQIRRKPGRFRKATYQRADIVDNSIRAD